MEGPRFAVVRLGAPRPEMVCLAATGPDWSPMDQPTWSGVRGWSMSTTQSLRASGLPAPLRLAKRLIKPFYRKFIRPELTWRQTRSFARDGFLVFDPQIP